MIEQTLAVATSLGTLLMMYLAGRKKSLAWIVGLINQALWVAFIIAFEAWGLTILTGALTVIYGRNLYLWRTEETKKEDWEAFLQTNVSHHSVSLPLRAVGPDGVFIVDDLPDQRPTIVKEWPEMEVTQPRQPFEFQPSTDADDVTLEEAVFQALGGASMCWDPPPEGVFASERAKEIGEKLLGKIQEVNDGGVGQGP